MTNKVSKSRFKAHALALFRQVQRTGTPLVITDHGKPVLTISPYRADKESAIQVLRDSVVKYDAPTKPVAEGDWAALT